MEWIIPIVAGGILALVAVGIVSERRRREAVNALASQFYEALQTGDDEKVKRAGKRLAKAMQSPWALAREDDAGSFAPPRRKYAIIFSALASVVEEAIADFAEEKDTIDTVMAAIAGLKREELLETEVESESFERAFAVLRKVREDANELEAHREEADSTRFVEGVRALLEDVAAVRFP